MTYMKGREASWGPKEKGKTGRLGTSRNKGRKGIVQQLVWKGEDRSAGDL